MATTVPFDLDAAADLTDLSIQEIWIKSPADLQEYHKDYYYVEPVKDYIVKDSSVTAISAFSKIPENGSIPADSPYQGLTFSQVLVKSEDMLETLVKFLVGGFIPLKI